MTRAVVLKRKPGDVQGVPLAQPVQIAIVVNGVPTEAAAGCVLHLKRKIRVPIHPVTNLLQVAVHNAVL